MSFKREGDDQALLHNLQMRRVGELLGEHIPEDEAKLLSNGRLTCLICNHRPIFDTCVMLANHRKGKKHIEELGKHLLHRRELEFRKLKSDHKQYVQTEGKKGNGAELKNKNFSRKIVLNVPRSDSSKSLQSVKPSATSVVRHYLKGIQRKRALQKTVERCRENYTIQKSLSTESSGSHSEASEHSRTEPPEKSLDSKPSDTNTCRDLQLRMAGWIKSSEGKWIKDPDVEFDSDEEPPDS